MQPGRMRTRVAFLRRAVVSARERGAYAPLFSVFAEYRGLSGREQAQAGQLVGFEAGVLKIWDSPRARTITVGDRARLKGADHRITSVALPAQGTIEIAVSTDLGEA